MAGALEALGRRVAVNAFNLDDRTRTIEGGIRLAELGLDPWGAKMARRAWLEQAYRLGKDFAI